MRISDWSSDVCSSDLIACALRSGSIPCVVVKIAVRINGSGLEEQIQLALTIQRGEIVVPTNMSPVYEYLRHRVPAIRPLPHLSALRPAQSNIIFFILHAFFAEQPLGTHAIGAHHLGINFHTGHNGCSLLFAEIGIGAPNVNRPGPVGPVPSTANADRKSTRLNYSH